MCGAPTPRDIGGHDGVKRHRILRRPMAYGGPLLDEGSLSDGEDKGLLFIAANAHLDLQFEVIQDNWINKGEFLSQAGLSRCPVTGSNDGKIADSFPRKRGDRPGYAAAAFRHHPWRGLLFRAQRQGDLASWPRDTSFHPIRKKRNGQATASAGGLLRNCSKSRAFPATSCSSFTVESVRSRSICRRCRAAANIRDLRPITRIL